MKILALQLKRIGDLVLTTPALRRLRLAFPEAHIALGVMTSTEELLPAIHNLARGAIVFGRGRGFAPWQQVLTGGWDLCLDFTGNDRSALATALSRAKKRVAFESVRKNKLRALAYNTWSPSQVREEHTAQYYADLVAAVLPGDAVPDVDLVPELELPGRSREHASMDLDSTGVHAPYALLHPGTARPEKYWLSERWRAVAAHLRDNCGLKVIVTSGPDAYERAHAQETADDFRRPPDLLHLAALVEGARIVVSCDTAVVHLAAAFRVPQIALFGPTNPYHWRPLHDRALVLSAAQPDAPLTQFHPRMKGAPMDHISTEVVIRAIDDLLGRTGNVEGGGQR